ncbi:CPBP family intramembrane glutamic endopeptidase [Pseudalkalibacillus hwajinpoensis]|uniref:CPBP family intramembrane glutamic endopeptidase n=1 Tax=Guptibacillus hwajinpoensis TaxID=208199 RepID=UPI001CFE8440|nr:CPBP family intramembrane glutamic endopeptidase [Pseudalkalibacillus hwajinpoensis]
MLSNKQLYFTLFLSHFLLFLSFFWFKDVFWPLFTISLLLLGGISIRHVKWKKPSFFHLLMGTFSGVFLYFVFLLGKTIMLALFPQFITQVDELYTLVAPDKAWHYVSLILIIIPGEELFWRGLVQTELKKRKIKYPILLAALLYMSAHLYAGAFLLLLAAVLAGFLWGYLYDRTHNMIVPLLSHLVFDLFLLVFFPLL